MNTKSEWRKRPRRNATLTMPRKLRKTARRDSRANVPLWLRKKAKIRLARRRMML